MTGELLTALTGFVELQEEQVCMLQTGSLKTLSCWAARREQAFNRLKECLEQFEPQFVSADSNEAGLIMQAMAAVRAGEKKLAGQAKNRQNDIRTKLKNMRKGKVVLNKYSDSRAAVAEPRYLSSRM
jgi:hypothetical protein